MGYLKRESLESDTLMVLDFAGNLERLRQHRHPKLTTLKLMTSFPPNGPPSTPHLTINWNLGTVSWLFATSPRNPTNITTWISRTGCANVWTQTQSRANGATGSTSTSSWKSRNPTGRSRKTPLTKSTGMFMLKLQHKTAPEVPQGTRKMMT